MRKLELALLTGLIAAVIISNVSGFESFKKSYDKLQNGVLRMHILANSDSEEDQKLKLKVRDRLLEYSEDIFGDETDIEDVKHNVSRNLNKIKEIAEKVIEENGFSYDVNCKLVNMEFDERVYDDITMPAGTYDALRVTIGNAEGKNWWCVMYPPLCVPAVSDKNIEEDKTVSASKNSEDMFDDGEYDMLTNPEKYEVKFKILEVYKSLKKKIQK